MKALFVSHSSKMSGANISFLSVIKELSSTIDIVVLVNDKNGDFVIELKKMGVDYICSKYGWWYAQYRNNIFKRFIRVIFDLINYITSDKSPQLIERLKLYNFDLVYSNTGTIDIGAFIAKSLNLPHIWHIREFGKEDFGLISLVSTQYMYNMLNASYRLIVISKALEEKFRNIVPADKLTIIYNGFDIDNLSAIATDPFSNGLIRILVTGQVCRAKGQHLAIYAINRVRGMGYPVTLTLAGDVDRGYIHNILKKIPGRLEWLRILGNVDDVYKLRNSMDIELICSHSEAFGRVTIESMLHCIPVIASNSGANPELIKDETTGLLFESGSVEDLSKKIIRLIEDKNLYSQIVSQAYEYAKKFTINNCVNQIYSIMNKAVCNHATHSFYEE